MRGSPASLRIRPFSETPFCRVSFESNFEREARLAFQVARIQIRYKYGILRHFNVVIRVEMQFTEINFNDMAYCCTWAGFSEWLFVKNASNWPVHLIYLIEILSLLLLTTMIAIIFWSRDFIDEIVLQILIVFIAFLSAFSIAYVFLLAPFFFFIDGLWMMGTIPLSPFVFLLCYLRAFNVLERNALPPSRRK